MSAPQIGERGLGRLRERIERGAREAVAESLDETPRLGREALTDDTGDEQVERTAERLGIAMRERVLE